MFRIFNFTIAVSVICFTPLLAGEPTHSMDHWVAAAVQAEEVGNLTLRKELLGRVLNQGGSDKARCLVGNIRTEDGQWTSIEESISAAKQSIPLANYLKRRSLASNSVAGHLEMAEYCRKARLPDQMRAHLAQVISLEPDHPYARQRLGHRRVGFDWLTPEQIAYFEQMRELAQDSQRKYARVLAKIFRGLDSSVIAEREDAERKLFALDGEDVVPALEGALVDRKDEVILVGLRWLHEQGSPSAIQSLSRFGIFHPSEVVRRVAGRYLGTRDIYEYAPQMMDIVKAPVNSLLIPLIGANGVQGGFRQIFSQEGAEHQRSLVVDTFATATWGGYLGQSPTLRTTEEVTQASRRVNQEVSDTNWSSYLLAMRRLANQEVGKRAAVDQQNQLTELVNQRVASLLSQTTGTKVPAEPQELWDWWYSLNEMERPQLRPTSYIRLVKQVSYSVWSSPRIIEVPPLPPTTFRRRECFVKGTPVMTALGLRPIDEIRPGDLVLSKEVRTGELSWKPVLQTTIRSPSPTLDLRAGQTPLRCTHAHVFWVSGKGWLRASQIREGDVLHCAVEPVIVESVQSAPDCETFNLVVADNANYFVGEQLALTHDVTSRSFAPESVPGQLREPEPL